MAKRPPPTKLGLSQRVAAKGGEAPPARKSRSKSGKASGGSKKPFRYLQTRLNDEGWHELKMLSVSERRPLQGLLIEALNDLLRKYRKAPVVEGPAEG